MEIQWILKIGVWARTEITYDTAAGKLMTELFVKKEKIRKREGNK